jgi:capsular exopolysaccharide synthesis family protein
MLHLTEQIDPHPRDPRRVLRPDAPVDDRAVGLVAPDSFEADQYRILKHRIERAGGSQRVRSIAVTSADVGDGKTTTAVNLAATFAQTAGQNTLLVDADVRRPAVLERLGLDPDLYRGLRELIDQPNLPVGDVLGWWFEGNLWVLPAGRCPDEPHRLAESPALQELFADLHRRFDRIVVDLPPLLPVLDARMIARSVDAVILVIGARRTTRRHVEEALTIIEPDRLLGVVLNGDEGLPVNYDDYRRYQRGSKEGRTRR